MYRRPILTPHVVVRFHVADSGTVCQALSGSLNLALVSKLLFREREMVEPVSAAATLGALKLLQKPIDELYEKAKKEIGFKIDKTNFQKQASLIINDVAENVVKVPTLFYLDQIVDLNKFYHAPRVLCCQEEKVVHNVDFFPTKKNLIVLGTAGQGKSIFMRYLAHQEAKKQQKIPVFLELRRAQKETIKDAIFNKLSCYFDDLSSELFEFLVKQGALVLFLDGFDEVVAEKANLFFSELEDMSVKYKKMKVIVSSRYQSDMEKSLFFEKVEIQHCDRKDQEIIIKKLVTEKEVSNSICNAIKSSSTQVEDLLKTPLLISMLVTKYLVNREIPESQYDFYRDIFDVLAQRHDRLKIGINRGFKSGLSVSKLQECFEVICVETKKRRITNFDFIIMCEIVDIAVKNLDLKANIDDIIHDITNNICLIVKDGTGYSFVHKSIQEFFVANFIAKNESKDRGIFMSISEAYQDYVVEISFLEYIDPYKWSKFFIIPVFEAGIQFFGFLSRDLLKDFLVKNILVVVCSEETDIGDDNDSEFVFQETLSVFSFYEDCSQDFCVGRINQIYKNYFSYFIFSQVFRFVFSHSKISFEAWYNYVKKFDIRFDCCDEKYLRGVFRIDDFDGFDDFLDELYNGLVMKVESAKKIVKYRESSKLLDGLLGSRS